MFDIPLLINLFISLIEIQSTLAISNMRYLKSRTFFLVPSASQIIRYLELIFSSLGRFTVPISNFSENVAHRNQSMKIFSCVFERVCLTECYFN